MYIQLWNCVLSPNLSKEETTEMTIQSALEL